jgi:hypothetical protein
LPPSDTFDIEVYPNRQPILRGGVGKNLDPVNALDAEEVRGRWPEGGV